MVVKTATDVWVNIDYTVTVNVGENILVPELRGRDPKAVDVEIKDVTPNPSAMERQVRVHGKVRSTT